MICWPNWRRRMPSRASSGLAAHHAEDVALRRVRIHAQQQVGAERWKKLSACDCTICARFEHLPQLDRGLGGMRTARIASHALAEAIRWLTGQMPQMRAISDGIS